MPPLSFEEVNSFLINIFSGFFLLFNSSCYKSNSSSNTILHLSNLFSDSIICWSKFSFSHILLFWNPAFKFYLWLNTFSYAILPFIQLFCLFKSFFYPILHLIHLPSYNFFPPIQIFLLLNFPHFPFIPYCTTISSYFVLQFTNTFYIISGRPINLFNFFDHFFPMRRRMDIRKSPLKLSQIPQNLGCFISVV